ncbi:MAG: transcriptional regulator [Candidatus Chisholmbacteria bacterium RIFCSPHIGHO2_01_FULL_49_18]|uniref:Transcriptional regulator n=2 Tax=Candidatus Chisholmiibacteriota TaxID=1817900 RepID=A0A1G1VPF3_9BACT|nr:MAG: transcriptional regulator [Candidatus Chisholmbacteria bacterium RIFCSPHIGHO2_01_FULL_49_18]OGY22551.1 MAG: transcriptional regulator [Candidatus Chisholmbacteria bacterium RIFCSPLOWO2_01_FULL_49_14]
MSNTTLNNYLKERLKDPKFKKAWDESEAQYQITRELIKARLDKHVSQRTLARKANTTQAVISRIENMSVSPSVRLLQKIASALGKKLEIRFVQ